MSSPWDFDNTQVAFNDALYAFDGSYNASSSAGGVILPQQPFPLDDEGLDALLQSLVAAVTGLPASLVRPRWQPVVPQQPSVTTDWCAIGIVSATPDAGPWLSYDPLTNTGPYTRHETLELMATFYGPHSKQYAALLRDGLAVPQNCDVLRANNMAYVAVGVIRAIPELINQQWIKRQDIGVTIRRKIVRNYAIESIAIVEVVLVDDEPPTAADFAENGGSINPPETVIGTIVVPPDSPVEP